MAEIENVLRVTEPTTKVVAQVTALPDLVVVELNQEDISPKQARDLAERLHAAANLADIVVWANEEDEDDTSLAYKVEGEAAE